MGSVLLKMDDQHEKKLRALAKAKFGNKKGSLTKIVEHFIDKEADVEIKRRAEAFKRIDSIVEKNRKRLAIGYKFNREELYAERTG